MLSEEEQVKELYAQATAELDPNLPLLEALEQRGEIFAELARCHRSDETCCFLRKQLLKPENQFISFEALEYVANNCYDDELNTFLKACSLFDGFLASLYAKQHSRFGEYIFSHIDEATGCGYILPQEAYVCCLEELLDSVDEFGIETEDELSTALEPISEYLGWNIFQGSQSAEHLWRNDNVRQILINRAKYTTAFLHPNYPHYLRSEALEYLVQYWPDDETHQLLKECLEQDQEVYSKVFNLLAQNWPDNETYQILYQHAEHTEWFIRSSALECLADNWQILEVYELLYAGTSDDNLHIRHTAFEMLLKHWPSDENKQLIKKQAQTDMAAASIWATAHSEFGKKLFWELFYGEDKIIPQKPIPLKYIENKAYLAIDSNYKNLDDALASLSEHMGWDITKGSQA
ncbi:hypothetical protein [Candidatus Albibeggiatoa sp. nov. NOAA]|uniref:hypothetical protein n=1 Tax=Candidatus Albibeggiatoa sp. nov. NOAA TaxID=3162724 RepID=UPI0033010891|nr:hypothetical protein [Thiotrichaceae bacterium]